jgi:dipeptidyl aminopeptidase/acylaminoacyl peptidase
MSLDPGTRLGSYELIAPLGSGGMGEVYRARDLKLGREVAIKVLPVIVAFSAERRARFEREARAIASLSHPNVLTIFDFGTHEGRTYAVMELLEGETLRKRLREGPLPLRKAVDYAVQMAEGLAAAHDKGIVHRDLKPENVIVTLDGRVKILDFGLARIAVEDAPGAPDVDTQVHRTDPGTVLGTAAYMAPEQVRGEPADHRSDIFAFGCLLYEMLAGVRAFARATPVETMSAILRAEPPPFERADAPVPPSLERIVRRCLEKQPSERFQSARDLAFHLQDALDDSRPARRALGDRRPAGPRPGLAAVVAIGALALAMGLAAGYWAGVAHQGLPASGPEPTFSRLTYGRGMIRNARFAPDGKTVIFGAAWDGQPTRLYLGRTESTESTPLSLPDGEILSVASTGELAVSLGHRYDGWMGEGTLARAPMLGDSARPLLERVREADWTPDGTGLAIVRRAGGRERLEFPIDYVLYESTGYISHIRFSPGGDRIAFADHPLFADDVGYLAVVDRAGHKQTLTEFWGGGLRSLAWSPSGDEIYFTASRRGEDAALRAVDLSGRQRHVLGGPSHLLIFDVARDGRLLLGRETFLRTVEALTPLDEKPRDFSLAREGSIGKLLTADGRTLLLSDQYSHNYTTYLRRVDEPGPVRLGEGEPYDLSPDGRLVLAVTPESPSRILLHPTGAGPSREVPNPERLVIDTARWHPDGRRIVIVGQSPARRARAYVMDVEGGLPRPFTPEQIEQVRWWALPLAPDGSKVILRSPEGRIVAYRIEDGAAEAVPGLEEGDVPVQYAADGRSLFVGRFDRGSWHVRRVDLATGRATPVREIRPPDIAGLRISLFTLTPDGRYYAHSYSRLLTDLYVVEGIR